MSVKQQSWKWRNRPPRCDQCGDTETRRMRMEVDWAAQVTKTTWRCMACGNHVFVYAQKKAAA